jgi:hypothetical protein
MNRGCAPEAALDAAVDGGFGYAGVDPTSGLCAHKPCKCVVAQDEIFCGDICAMLGAKLVNQVSVESAVPLKSDDRVVPRCACGHAGCGDSLVNGNIH